MGTKQRARQKNLRLADQEKYLLRNISYFTTQPASTSWTWLEQRERFTGSVDIYLMKAISAQNKSRPVKTEQNTWKLYLPPPTFRCNSPVKAISYMKKRKDRSARRGCGSKK